MREESYYQLLQVSPTADLEIITAAYRALIRRHHPDRNPSPSAEATTKRLNEAWEVLSDAASRAEYDRSIATGSPSDSPPPPRTPDPPTQETRPPRPKPPPPRASGPDPTGGGNLELIIFLIFMLVIIVSIPLLAWAST